MYLNRAESIPLKWAAEEFKEVDLGDQRLNSRLIKLADRFSALPEVLSIKLVLTGLKQKVRIDF